MAPDWPLTLRLLLAVSWLPLRHSAPPPMPGIPTAGAWGPQSAVSAVPEAHQPAAEDGAEAAAETGQRQLVPMASVKPGWSLISHLQPEAGASVAGQSVPATAMVPATRSPSASRFPRLKMRSSHPINTLTVVKQKAQEEEEGDEEETPPPVLIDVKTEMKKNKKKEKEEEEGTGSGSGSGSGSGDEATQQPVVMDIDTVILTEKKEEKEDDVYNDKDEETTTTAMMTTTTALVDIGTVVVVEKEEIEEEEDEDDNDDGEEETTPTDSWLIDTNIVLKRLTTPELTDTNNNKPKSQKLSDLFEANSIVKERHKPPDLISTSNKHKPPEQTDTSSDSDNANPPELEDSNSESDYSNPPKLVLTSSESDSSKIPEMGETSFVQSSIEKPPEFFNKEGDRTTPPKKMDISIVQERPSHAELIDSSIKIDTPIFPELIDTSIAQKPSVQRSPEFSAHDRPIPSQVIKADIVEERSKLPELIDTSIIQSPVQRLPELIDTSIKLNRPKPPELIESSTVLPLLEKPPEFFNVVHDQPTPPKINETNIILERPKPPELIESSIVSVPIHKPPELIESIISQPIVQRPPEFFNVAQDQPTPPKIIKSSIIQERPKPPELIETSIVPVPVHKPPELIKTSILPVPVQKPPELFETTIVQKIPELGETSILPVQKPPELIKIVGDRPTAPQLIETSIVEERPKLPELIDTSIKQAPVQKPPKLLNIVSDIVPTLIKTSPIQERPKPPELNEISIVPVPVQKLPELIEASIVQPTVQKPPKLFSIVSTTPEVINTSIVEERFKLPALIETKSNVSETPELIDNTVMTKRPKPTANIRVPQKQVARRTSPQEVIISSMDILHPTIVLREMYFLQPVDHFTFTNNNRTFLQRYLFTDKFQDTEDGPIFFYTGNEGDIWNFANNSGFIIELAAEHNALVVFAEHRYYGKSLPFGSKSLEKSNVVFLSVEQALADFAVLLTKLKILLDAEDRSVVAFGGSYGGMLSAYMRIKYPNIVVGALASSAPIISTAGIGSSAQFFHDVTKEYESYNSDCSQQIREAFQALEALRQQEEWNEITRKMHLCETVMFVKDIKQLYGWARNGFTVMAMFNYPYQMNTPNSLPGNPVNLVCRIIELIPDPIEALHASLEIYYNTSGDVTCFDIYKQFIPCADPTGCALGAEGQAWDFQACTQINLLYESNGLTDMFPAMPFTDVMRDEYCHRKWGVSPNQDWLRLQYWGNDLTTASNIIFSNGVLDPWANGGVVKNVSSSVIALMIDGAAHHLDLRGSHPDDPTTVTLARQLESLIIKTWVKNHQLYISRVYSEQMIT